MTFTTMSSSISLDDVNSFFSSSIGDGEVVQPDDLVEIYWWHADLHNFFLDDFDVGSLSCSDDRSSLRNIADELHNADDNID